MVRETIFPTEDPTDDIGVNLATFADSSLNTPSVKTGALDVTFTGFHVREWGHSDEYVTVFLEAGECTIDAIDLQPHLARRFAVELTRNTNIVIDQS